MAASRLTQEKTEEAEEGMLGDVPKPAARMAKAELQDSPAGSCSGPARSWTRRPEKMAAIQPDGAGWQRHRPQIGVASRS